MSPSRSTKVTVVNELDHDLTVKAWLAHGEWTQGLKPPGVIEAHSSVDWQSESDGMFTGTEGGATLTTVDDNVYFGITWDNPFSGHNSYSTKCPKGYHIEYSGGSGDNSEVAFVICKFQLRCTS
jgi:hypothetical protein